MLGMVVHGRKPTTKAEAGGLQFEPTLNYVARPYHILEVGQAVEAHTLNHSTQEAKAGGSL